MLPGQSGACLAKASSMACVSWSISTASEVKGSKQALAAPHSQQELRMHA